MIGSTIQCASLFLFKISDIVDIMERKNITISGAGLVGSLLGTMLAQQGHNVQIHERRVDMRTDSISAGRSINLAMSDRGLRALEVCGIANDIRSIAIPMYCRVIHDEHGGLREQPYGKVGQAINSVSRGTLNKKLMTVAEQHGAQITFNSRCTAVDVRSTTATFHNTVSNAEQAVTSDVIFGADGAFSAVRSHLQTTDRFSYSQSYLDHSYKELHIPPTADGGFRMEKHALHIWPRHSFMLIALPNLDGSFTCTLFLSHNGSPGFTSLQTEAQIIAFFKEYFPDVIPLMPTLVEDFLANPESSLVTVKCYPWVRNNVVLIGDAAHALVPFYGQGMNCGFEDCRILMDCLAETNHEWSQALELYQHYRKPDGDAIADLAVENFVEMRDKVADELFLRRKKLEAYLHEHYPTKFIPQYTLVTFASDVPYCEAKRMGAENEAFATSLMHSSELAHGWDSLEAQAYIQKQMNARPPLIFKAIGPK